ncbi:MAG: hypothetical protein KF886_05870 [Candidatus Hydrogenedentes bacterium]|nr:hypothetical protein [Candidatus Hydrogenedentota bacterium]
MSSTSVKVVTDADGREIEVIVPIAVWRQITSSREVAALLERAVGAPGAAASGERLARRSRARIGADELTGLPVFLTPPDSPTLTLEDVKRLEDEW